MIVHPILAFLLLLISSACLAIAGPTQERALDDSQKAVQAPATTPSSPLRRRPLSNKKNNKTSTSKHYAKVTSLLPRHKSFFDDLEMANFNPNMNAEALNDAFRKLLDKHVKTTGSWALKELKGYLLQAGVSPATVTAFQTLRQNEMRRDRRRKKDEEKKATGFSIGKEGHAKWTDKQSKDFINTLTVNNLNFDMSAEDFVNKLHTSDINKKYSNSEFGARMVYHFKTSKVPNKEWRKEYRKLQDQKFLFRNNSRVLAELKMFPRESSTSSKGHGSRSAAKSRLRVTLRRPVVKQWGNVKARTERVWFARKKCNLD